MATLAPTSLSEAERRSLGVFVEGLREHFGDGLDSLWLYGSRARGEPPHSESDVDLTLLLDDPSFDNHLVATRLMQRAQATTSTEGTYFSVKLYDRAWVEGRRAIESFFMREVDRDKVVLHGEP